MDASALHSLQGALGKTSGRSYKAAPRQLLQVDAANPGASPTVSPAHAHISKESVHTPNEGAAKEAAKLGREALGNAGDVRLFSAVHFISIYKWLYRQLTLFAKNPSHKGRSWCHWRISTILC